MADPIPSPGPAHTPQSLKNNQSKSNRGGKRAGAGRRKGAANKATRDIREAAQEYTSEALETFVDVMTNSDSDAARVAAADKILDRGYGKAKESKDLNINLAFGDALERASRRLVGRDV